MKESTKHGEKETKKINMLITISGTPGAGDTTTSEKLAQELNYKVVHIGEIQKQLAKQRGITPEKLWEEQEKNPKKLEKFNRKLDQKQVTLAQKEDNLILNGKLSALHIQNAKLKIFLDADITERAKRTIMREKIGRRNFAEKVDQKQEYNEPSAEEIKKQEKKIKEREEKETKHWKKIYNFNYIKDKEAYNLVIDTTDKRPEEVVKIIKNKVKKIQDD